MDLEEFREAAKPKLRKLMEIYGDASTVLIMIGPYVKHFGATRPIEVPENKRAKFVQILDTLIRAAKPRYRVPAAGRVIP